MVNPTLEQCQAWRKNKLVNPLTKRKISEGGPVYKQLEKACKTKSTPVRKSPASSKPQKVTSASPKLGSRKPKIKKADCLPPQYSWKVGKGCFAVIPSSPAKKPSPVKQSTPKKPTPVKQSIPKKPTPVKQSTPKKSSPVKRPFLTRLEQTCSDMSDPIFGDEFADLEDKELETVVMIGKDEKKHCYLLDSIYEAYRQSILNDKIPSDPMDPSHALTKAEIEDILKKKKQLDPKFVAPKKEVIEYGPFELRVSERNNFFYIDVLKNLYQRYNLGVIPSNIEPADFGRLASVDYSSAVALDLIMTRWNKGKLFNPEYNAMFKKGVLPPTPIYKGLLVPIKLQPEEWKKSFRGMVDLNALKDFIDKLRDM
jgi:hypothetical protein